VPKELQRWYDGQTTVMLPGGRQIRPPAFTFLKYNTEAFRGRVVTVPDGSIVTDLYWWGNGSFTYGDIRGAGRDNWNLSVERTFRTHERFSVDFSAEFTNAFNHTQFRPQMTVALGGTSVLALDAALSYAVRDTSTFWASSRDRRRNSASSVCGRSSSGGTAIRG
jgi:hypothetical protein